MGNNVLTQALAEDYIREMKHHMDTGDNGTARIILDLLEELVTDDTSWRVMESYTCPRCRATHTGNHTCNSHNLSPFG